LIIVAFNTLLFHKVV